MRKGIQGHYLMLRGSMNLSKSIKDFTSSPKGIISLETRLSLERECHIGLRLGHASNSGNKKFQQENAIIKLHMLIIH